MAQLYPQTGPHSVYVRDPDTGKTLATLMNRISPTIATFQEQQGAVAPGGAPHPVPRLCKVYCQSRGGCRKGSQCDMVHVDRAYIWEPIQPRVVDGKYERGFSIRCYDKTLKFHYCIPSECIFETAGSTFYLSHYNSRGEFSRHRPLLCEAMIRNGSCAKNEACMEIHPAHELRHFPATSTHDASRVDDIPRMDPNVIFRVFKARSNTVFVDGSGADVLETAGAKTYLARYTQKQGIPTELVMQQCVHFRGRFCRRGNECNFIHYLSPPEDWSRSSTPQGNSPPSTPSNSSEGSQGAARVNWPYQVSED